MAKRFGRCGALLPLFRLVGVRSIAAFVESEEPTASPRRSPETGCPSIPCAARRARKRDRVAHVGEAGDVGERALEAQPEARVRHRSVPAQVAIPGVMLL